MFGAPRRRPAADSTSPAQNWRAATLAGRGAGARRTRFQTSAIDVDAARAHRLREPLGLGAHDRLVERDDDDAAARAIVQQRVERARPLREVEQLLRGVAESDDVAILEHQAHEPVRPVERDRRHLEQPQQMSGRRGIDDDARESSARASASPRIESANSSSMPGGASASRSRRIARSCVDVDAARRRARRTARRSAPDTRREGARTPRSRPSVARRGRRRRRAACSTSSRAHAASRSPSASAIDGAGSVETSRVGPVASSAAAMASAHATVLFPTPPFPPTIVSVRASMVGRPTRARRCDAESCAHRRAVAVARVA